jgi:Protein of unknown function (DUF3563)
MLEKLLGLFKNDAQKNRDEQYLNESVDIYQLEQRMNGLDNERSNYMSNPFNAEYYRR